MMSVLFSDTLALVYSLAFKRSQFYDMLFIPLNFI